MRTRLVAFFVGALAVSAVAMSPLSPVQSFVAGRTPSELALFTLLNGERARDTQADGGGLMLYTADAGVASVTVRAGTVVYIENPGSVACHLCGANAGGTWDGGCNTTVGDVNYGSPIAASGGQRWISLRDTPDGGATLKAVPASGTTCTLPVYFMQ